MTDQNEIVASEERCVPVRGFPEMYDLRCRLDDLEKQVDDMLKETAG